MNYPVIEKPTTPQTSYVLLYNVSWDQLEKLDVNLEGTSARLTYLDGILEIMSPLSDDHEEAKTTFAMLLFVICELRISDFMVEEVRR